MSCKLGDARPDWKSYALGEFDARARQEREGLGEAAGTPVVEAGEPLGFRRPPVAIDPYGRTGLTERSHEGGAVIGFGKTLRHIQHGQETAEPLRGRFGAKGFQRLDQGVPDRQVAGRRHLVGDVVEDHAGGAGGPAPPRSLRFPPKRPGEQDVDVAIAEAFHRRA